MKIAICGIPRSGKTSLARTLGSALGIAPHHADDLIGRYEWSELSAEIARRLSEPGDWIWEGVAMARVLRKWLAANPTGKPCDEAVYLTRPWVELSKGQKTLAAGTDTIWKKTEPELRARGVTVTIGAAPHLRVVA